jgi:hypothetical protein
MRSGVCRENWGRRRLIAILFVELAFNQTEDRGQTSNRDPANHGRRKVLLAAVLSLATTTALAAEIAPDDRQFYLMERVRGMPMDAPTVRP